MIPRSDRGAAPDDPLVRVDLLLLSRDTAPAREDVAGAVAAQWGVEVTVHRVIGSPRADETNRLDTIVRARNSGRGAGSAPWVMLLDDDVVLATDCLARLVEGLQKRPEFAALAADCTGEMTRTRGEWDHPVHVGMAAVMFRRACLERHTFRWAPGKCECRCCCDDLRHAGLGIGYLRGAVAVHRPRPPDPPRATDRTHQPGRILAAFDRRDHAGFVRQFLHTLRAAGNREPVTAVAYGLRPAERRALADEPGVEVVAVPHNGVCPALRRLRDFQRVIARWPGETAVAYWDAGDVRFQGRLGPLWDLVRDDPDTLLIVPDASGYPENPVVTSWSDCILDPDARRRAFELMSTHTFLNSGFAAGTVRSLMSYLREGDRLLRSDALRGVGPWGDQPALNLYCHTRPGAWKAVPVGWNFNLAGRDFRQFQVQPDGRYVSTRGESIVVVHGNAGILRWRHPLRRPLHFI